MANARVAMIGWDSADRDTVEALLRAGELPHLAALRQRGFHGRVSGLPGLGDDGCWATFSTGVGPGRHGRFHHVQIDGGTQAERHFPRDRMSAPPFWAALGTAGRRVAVLDVPKSPLARNAGCIELADWLPHGEDGPVPVSWPAELARDMPERYRLPPGFSCHHVRSTREELDALHARIREHLERRSALALDWLDRERWDLFLAVFAESHCIGHHCWSPPDRAAPREAARREAAPSEPVREIYRGLDAALGRIVAQCGPEVRVLVFSLIGMHENRMGSWMVEPVLARLATTWRTTRGTGGGRRTRHLGQRLAALMRRQTRSAARAAHDGAFALHSDSVASAIRIRLAGRDADGCVPPQDYEAWCDRLAAEFLAITHPDDGRRLVSEVVRVAARYPGPRAAAYADLLVVWNQDGPLDAATAPALGTLRAPATTDRTGNHRIGGWFAGAGPGIEAGEAPSDVAIVDFAPTVYRALGIGLAGLEGSPIARLAP